MGSVSDSGSGSQSSQGLHSEETGLRWVTGKTDSWPRKINPQLSFLSHQQPGSQNCCLVSSNSCIVLSCF